MRHDTGPMAGAIAPIVALCLVLSSCNHGGGSGGGSEKQSTAGATGSVDLLIHDAPLDDLLSFELTVAEARLVRPNGTMTGNLLPRPTPLELLGLQDRSAWIAAADVAVGTYSAVRIVIIPGTTVARDRDGADVRVEEIATAYSAPLAAPIDVVEGARVAIDVDLNLMESLDRHLLGPILRFEPEGLAEELSVDARLDDVIGLVSSFDATHGTLDVVVLSDDALDPKDSWAALTVHVDESTLLLQENGLEYVDAGAFFGFLVAARTRLEIEGTLAPDGTFTAATIEVEDQLAGQLSTGEVKIDGVVASIDPNGSFGLLVRDVDKNAASLVAAVQLLDGAATIPVEVDPWTTYVVEDASTGDWSDLRVGQEVEVRFGGLSAAPFMAEQVEIEHRESRIEAVVVDTGGLPDSITVTVDDLFVRAGVVEDAMTPVVVQLDPDRTGFVDVVLDISDGVALEATDLHWRAPIRLTGIIEGSTDGPSVAPSSIVAHAGELRGTVSSVRPDVPSFVVVGTTVVEPFGGMVVGGPVTVHVPPGAKVEGDAADASELFGLFFGSPAGAIRVEVRGISNGFAHEVVASTIEVELETP